jgi:hypothetical protein
MMRWSSASITNWLPATVRNIPYVVVDIPDPGFPLRRRMVGRPSSVVRPFGPCPGGYCPGGYCPGGYWPGG